MTKRIMICLALTLAFWTGPARAEDDCRRAFGRGDYPVAAEECRRAAEAVRGADRAAALELRGRAFYRLNQFDQALAAYQEALTADPKAATVYNNRALVRYRAGQVKAALDDLDQAVRLQPDLAEAYNNRGWIKYKNGNAAGAKADLTKAVGLKPDLASALTNLGLIAQGEGDQSGAAKLFDRATAADPDYGQAYLARGWAAYLAGRARQAVADLDLAVEKLASSNLARERRGWANLAAGRSNKALDDFKSVIAKTPTNSRGYVGRGEAQRLRGRYEEAMNDFLKAMELDHRNVDAVRRLAWLMATCPSPKVRDGAMAKVLAEQAVDLAKGKPDAWTLDALAAAYAEANDLTKAVQAQEKALGLIKQTGPAQSVGAFEKRLAAYKAGKPWRDPQ